MIIAIATDGAQVAQHFGRCQSYTLVTIENGKETGKSVIDTPGHEPGFLPRFLREKGAGMVVAGGMGPMAQSLFEQQGIETVVGISAGVGEVISMYLKGTLRSGGNICDH